MSHCQRKEQRKVPYYYREGRKGLQMGVNIKTGSKYGDTNVTFYYNMAIKLQKKN